jgi:hypothetical protein
MSQIHWLNAINGSFTNLADWGGGMVPGASDDAILDAVGPAFTVTSGRNEKVESLQLAANATLSLTGKTFTAIAGTGTGANAGVILVGAGATLVAGGTVTNTGTIELYGAAGGKGGGLLLFNGLTTLTGGGELLLEGQGGATVGETRGNRGEFFYNVDNTIAGSGRFAGHLELINEQGGTIDANGSTPLLIAGDCINDGLMEATGSGGLTFAGVFITGESTGVILAATGSIVQVKPSGRLQGGTLESQGSGKFLIEDGYMGDDLVNDAHLVMLGGCELIGTIINNGKISLSKGGIALLNAVTLEGNGDINLGGGGIGSGIYGVKATLMLASGTISGPGGIGGEASKPLDLILGAAAVIDGNGATSLTLGAYTSIVNAGTIESTGLGGVVIDDAIVNNGMLSVQGGGTFAVEGAVSGKGKAIVGGGTLEFLSGFNEGVTFTSSGTLELAQSQGFTNSIKGFSDNGKTTLDLRDIGFVGTGEASFSGTSSGGVLTVTDGTHTARITLKGNYLGSTFVASSDGSGGTDVIAQKTQGAVASPHAFVAAMAGIGLPAASALQAGELWIARMPILASSRGALP